MTAHNLDLFLSCSTAVILFGFREFYSYKERARDEWKVDRVLANESLFLTAGTPSFQHSLCLVWDVTARRALVEQPWKGELIFWRPLKDRYKIISKESQELL